MGFKRVTTAALLAFIAIARTTYAQCASDVRAILSSNDVPALEAGPIAWNGNVLAVAMRQANSGAVWAAIYNQQGDRLSPAVRLTSSENNELLENIWNGEHFGIFYRTAENDLVLRKVATTGELLGPPVVPLQGRLQPDDRIDIIWSSRLDGYLVARTAHVPNRTIFLTILNRDGTRRTVTQFAPAAPQSFIRIAETASGVIGIFHERETTRELMMISIDPERADITRTVWSAGQPPLVTTWDNQFVLVREVLQDGRRSIRFKIVNTTGFDTREDTRLLFGSGLDVRPLALMERDGELALTYLDAKEGFDNQSPAYRLVRFTPRGDILSDTYFAAAEPQRHRATSAYDFIWTGASYLAAAVRNSFDGKDSYIIRLCPLTARVAGPTRVARNTPVTFVAAPEGGVPGFSYEWRFGDIGYTTGPTLQLTHTTTGTYTVELSVVDASGAVSREKFTYVVFEPAPPPRRRSVRK